MSVSRSSPDVNLDEARAAVRSRQEEWALRQQRSANTGDARDAAIQSLAADLASHTPQGEYLRRGVFKYPRKLEEQRYAIARAIIERVHPGPYEDVKYIELLALQAASIQGFVANRGGESPYKEWADGLTRVVIGTTAEPRTNAYSKGVAGSAIIMVSYGMLDSLYQAGKAVVLAQRQVAAPEGVALTFAGTPDDIEAVLDADPYPVTLLRDTLITWLYRGLPRAPHSSLPKDVYHPPLSLLIACAERFILAHEYGHVVFDILKSTQGLQWQQLVGSSSGKGWDREIRADLFGLDILNESASVFDLLPTNVSWQGAILAMKAHELFERAMGIALHGTPSVSGGSRTHPPFALRAEIVKRSYEQNYPENDDGIGLEGAVDGLMLPARTLEQLWRRAAPFLEAEFKTGRTVHPLWSAYSTQPHLQPEPDVRAGSAVKLLLAAGWVRELLGRLG